MATRRQFLIRAGGALLALGARVPTMKGPQDSRLVTLCLLGDVMTGRGIDQVLPHPSPPRIYESYAKNAELYVSLAEKANGPIPRPVDPGYIWGDALSELDRVQPDLRIINLETAVTRSDDAWPDKGIHYRMHPRNVGCLTRAGIDCCTLANNHVLDWGYAGLTETLETLQGAGLVTAGAGRDLASARAAAVFDIGGSGRVIVVACGSSSSGIPRSWAAANDRPGVHLLDERSEPSVRAIASSIAGIKRPRDLAVVSVHWGGNWGYDVPRAQRHFAHKIIDEAGVDIVHGHSSHHPRGIEVYRDRPILYGCGDFLNDYEGISGRDEYRSELVLMYFPLIDTSEGKLVRFSLSPLRIERFRLNRPTTEEVEWVRQTLSREGERFGTWVEPGPGGTLALRWGEPMQRCTARRRRSAVSGPGSAAAFGVLATCQTDSRISLRRASGGSSKCPGPASRSRPAAADRCESPSTARQRGPRRPG